MIVNDKIKSMSMTFELVKWVEQIIRSEAVKDCASKLLNGSSKLVKSLLISNKQGRREDSKSASVIISEWEGDGQIQNMVKLDALNVIFIGASS